MAAGLAEFAWVIQRYRIDHVLMRRHYLRLGVGLGATVLVVAYNAFHLHASEHLAQRSLVADWLILGFLVGCLGAITVVGLQLRLHLARHAPTLRLRVMQVVDVVHRWGNLLLFLAALGHAVIILGTLLGLDLMTPPGYVLLAALAPVVLLIIHGLTQVPTLSRLVAIHAASWAPEA